MVKPTPRGYRCSSVVQRNIFMVFSHLDHSAANEALPWALPAVLRVCNLDQTAGLVLP
jgi:hypothetical protein